MRVLIAVMMLSVAVTGAAEGGGAAGDLEIARKGQALIARLTLPAEQVVGLFWYGWPAAQTTQMRRPLDDFLVHVG